MPDTSWLSVEWRTKALDFQTPPWAPGQSGEAMTSLVAPHPSLKFTNTCHTQFAWEQGEGRESILLAKRFHGGKTCMSVLAHMKWVLGFSLVGCCDVWYLPEEPRGKGRINPTDDFIEQPCFSDSYSGRSLGQMMELTQVCVPTNRQNRLACTHAVNIFNTL